MYLDYTKYMTMKFARAEPASAPKTDTAPRVALFYAVILLIMAVAQLFSFEKFIPLVEGFGLPGGHGTAALVASVLVIIEVFALPFLLRMRLSPLMRIVSMVCGWLVVAAWLKLAIWANIAGSSMDNMGIFGPSLMLPVGWWVIPYVVALGILAAWASWGMWPVGTTRTKRSK